MATAAQTPRERRDAFAELHRLVKGVHAVMADADGVSLWLVRGDELVCACGSGEYAAEEGTASRAHRGLPGVAVRRGVTVCSEGGCDTDEVGHRRSGRDEGPSLAASPLRDAGEIFGVLEISAERPDAFSTETVAQLDALSDVAAQAAVRALDAAGSGGERADPDQPERVAASARASDVAAEMRATRHIRRAIDGRGILICGQPIARLADGRVAAVEALARFSAASAGPAAWFARAHELGLGLELERAMTRRALANAAMLPDDVRLSINLSPAALLDPEMAGMLCGAHAGRLVVELTEHVEVGDYDQVRRVAQIVRSAGALLAVDDVGAGYSSLLHVVKIVPDLIKLDRCLIQGLDLDPVRRHLCGALAAFGRRIDAEVVAEGIETAGELEVVQELGISLGQGYLLDRPQPFDRLSFALDHVRPVSLVGGGAR